MPRKFLSPIQHAVLTTAQRDAISSPPDGLEVYNSTLKQLEGRINGAWEGIQRVATSGVPGKLAIFGHSYATFNADMPTTDYKAGGIFGPESLRGHTAWSYILSELLGISQHGRWMQAFAQPVAAGNDLVTVLGMVPEESLIEGVWYLPVTSITGANTNTREVLVRIPTNFTAAWIGHKRLNSGINFGSWADLASIQAGWNMVMNPTGVGTSVPTAAVRGQTDIHVFPGLNAVGWIGSGGLLRAGTILTWHSLHIGTGIADPGGLVLVRLGGRLRLAAVGGSSLIRSGMYTGGWTTAMLWGWDRQLPGGEINITANATAGSNVVMTCSQLEQTIGASASVTFSNGATATVNGSGAGIGATSITMSTLSANVNAGEQGYTTSTVGGEVMQPHGIPVFGWGVNDAGMLATADASAWRECVRAVCAYYLCPYFSRQATQGNIVYAAGNGAAAAWANTQTGVQSGGGNVSHFPFDGAAKIFTGAVGGTKPTITIKIAATAMQGTCVDLFFAALVGTSRGGRATITVDGSTPPNGSCVVDLSGISGASGLDTVDTIAMTATTTNAANTLARTAGGNFTDPWDIGKYVTGPGVAVNTWIQSVTSTTAAVLSQNAGAGAGSGAVKLIPVIPMVKRITGLAANTAHTILVTIDAMDASGVFMLMGYGIECDTPSQPVFFHNVPRIPNTNVGGYAATNPDTNIQTLNTELAAVVAGTASVVGSNTTEPALPASVAIVDIDAALGRSTANFQGDGLHPNARGMNIIAEETYDAIMRVCSTRQYASR